MYYFERMQVCHRIKELFGYEADILFLERIHITFTLQSRHILKQIARLDQLLHNVKVIFIVKYFVSGYNILMIDSLDNQ